MKFFPSPSSGVPFCLAATLLAGLSGGLSAQTLPEALDSPEISWTSGGPVEVITDAASTYDGSDAVRLNPDPANTSRPTSWIATTISQPSIVTFRHRSKDLNGTAWFSVFFNGKEDDTYVASFWKEERQVVLPGLFRINNLAGPQGNPLYVDTVTITPAVTLPLNAALNAPGVEFSAPDPLTGPFGIADAASAPDGVDAVWLNELGELTTPVAGEAVVSFRGTATAELVATAERPLEVEIAGRRQFGVGPEGVTVRWRRDGGTGILDQVKISPAMPFAQALDSPGLVYEYVKGEFDTRKMAAFPTADAPPGAQGGHAVYLASFQPANGYLRLKGLSGPGVLRFSKLGDLRPYIQDTMAPVSPASTEWVRVEIPLPAGPLDVKLLGGGWLDQLSWTPGAPPADAATLMGQPGADVTFPHPDRVSGMATAIGTGNDTGLGVLSWYGTAAPELPLVRIGCQGPAMVSFAASSVVPSNISADGSSSITAADALSPDRQPEFAVIFPDALPHSVGLDGLAVYHQLKIQPLVEVPLNEALDAPGLTFTTSPATPWRGYKTGAALGASQGSAACGGVHAEAANPWIETTVTGPGRVRFAMARTASDPGDFTSEFLQPLKVTVNGSVAILRASPNHGLSEIYVAAGTHTVRWTQRGSQVTQGKGSLAWLDQVSFLPSSETLTYSGVLEAGGRTWSTAGGLEGLSAVSWPPEAVSGNSVIFTPPAGASPSLSTLVDRPCVIRFAGTGLQVTGPDGLLGSASGGAVTDNKYLTVPGSGPGRITFTAQPGQCAVLDRFAAYTQLPFLDTGAATWGTNPVWHFISRSLSWLTNQDYPADQILITPKTTYGYQYFEGTITGPCTFSAETNVLLPERNMRLVTKRLSFPGPQKIILQAWGVASDLDRAVISPFQARPGISLGAATGAPDLQWETGGNVPWMGESAADGTPLYAVSSNLIGGEVSWLETKVTGPAVLRWRVGGANSSGFTVAYTMLWNGIPVPGSLGSTAPDSGYLHLPAGENRIRWQFSANPLSGTQTSLELTLRDVALEPAPSPSIQEITGLSGVAFLAQQGKQMQPWSSLPGWTTAIVDGRSVLRVAAPLSLQPILPGPGDFAVVARADYPAETSTASSFAFAPYPWLPKSFAAPRGVVSSPVINTKESHPLPAGAQLLVDSVEFTPSSEVSLAEALDTPDLTWTSGSTGSASWRGFSGHGAGLADDPDAVQCRGLNVGESAWMETQITGPVRVSVGGQVPANEQTGFTVRIDGALATLPLRGSAGSTGSVGFSVPAGAHTVRLAWSPAVAASTALTMVISNITLIPETAVNIGTLVDSPELPWQAANVTFGAETADTFEGGSALRFSGSPTSSAVTTTVQGPGLLSVRIKGTASIGMDEVNFPAGGGSGYVLTEVPVPNGSHIIRFRSAYSSARVLLDAVHYQALPRLTAAEALDFPLGGFEPVDSPAYAAGAFASLSRDGADCVVLYPGAARVGRIRLPLPVPSRVSFYARSLVGSAVIRYGDSGADLTTSSWRLVQFDSDTLLLPDGLLGLEATGNPVRIDNLTITPLRGDYYLTWAASYGLSGGRAALNADPDGDDMGNLLEQAFGFDPTKPDAPTTGTDTVPGLPAYSKVWDLNRGGAVMEVRYWTRASANVSPSALNYTVETAADPSAGNAAAGQAGGWRTSAAASIPTGESVTGWTRMLWRSPDLIGSKPRDFVRIRIQAN